METMQYLWANLHFKHPHIFILGCLTLFFPKETKIETQSANVKVTPDKMASVSLKILKLFLFSKEIGCIRHTGLHDFSIPTCD